MGGGNNVRLQVLLQAVDKVSGPFKRIISGSKGVAAAIKTSRDALKGLNAAQRDIGAFRELHALNLKTSAAMQAQQQRVKALAAQIATAQTPSRKLNAEFKDAVRLAGTLKSKHQQQGAELQQLRGRLDSVGIGTRNLSAAERKLQADIARTTRTMQLQQSRATALGAARQRMQSTHAAGIKVAAHGGAALFAGERALRGAALPIGKAMEFESAMAGVRKVVNFDTPQQFAQMGNDIEDLSMTLPMLPAEIAKIVAAAGQAGVARKELIRFASDATKMGIAFDTTAEDAGQTMATWRTAFRMSQNEVVVLADKINYLGNTGPANVQKISDVVNRIGALGEVGGLQSGQIAALGATVAGMGIQSEVSATGIKNLILRLTAGASATKRQRGVFKALGIDAVQMAEHMQKDAGGAILSVLKKLRALPKATQNAALSNLFGTESVGAIAPLLTNLELLEKNLNKVGDASKYAGSMEAEYASRVATSENTMALAKNTILVLAQSVGKTLVPDFKALAAQTGEVVGRWVTWIRANPELVRNIARAVVVVAGMTAVLGAAALAVGTLMMPFAGLRFAVTALTGGGGFGGLVTKLGVLWARFAAFGGRVLPMVANGVRVLLPVLGGVSAPILALVAAIALVGVVVWKYWGPIKAFMVGVWQGLVEALAPVAAEIRNALAPLAPVWDLISGAIAKVWGWIKQLFTPFQATSEQLQNATGHGQTFGRVLGVALSAVIQPLKWTAQLIGWLVRQFITALPTITGIFGGIWTYIRGAWNLIAGIFSGNGGRIRAGLMQMWTGINAVLQGWPAKFLQFGINLMQGLINGISGMASGVKDAIVGAVGGAVDKFKNFLGIRSPSRLFAQFGDYTMQGFAGGLNRSQQLPVKSVLGLGNRMRQVGAGLAMGAAMSPAMAIDNRAPIGRTGGAVAAPAGGNHYEIHIHAAAGMSAEEIAKAVTAELDRRDGQKAARTRSRLGDYD